MDKTTTEFRKTALEKARKLEDLALRNSQSGHYELARQQRQQIREIMESVGYKGNFQP